MKKIKLLALFFAVFVSVSAQYQEGDVFEKDGLKATIIHIDENENRALVMTCPGIDFIMGDDPELAKGGAFKKAAKIYKESYTNIMYGLTGNESKKEAKNKANLVKNNVKALAGKTSNSGKENMKIVEQYCKDNNLKLEEAFPAFAWAKSLGKDWFIPGDDEVRIYAELIGAGIGKEKAARYKDFFDKYIKLNEKLIANGDIPLPNSIMSSSVSKKGEFYNHLITKTNQYTFKIWYVLYHMPDGFSSKICAVSYVDLD
ncbi:MAG: hypothetical protein IJ341_08295 [Bacteroidales bacterium]|nr:hypothetical protein [Bacteroidales bacterium]